MSKLLTFKTPGTSANSVEFSPFSGNQLVCTAAENYGLAGRGVLFFLEAQQDKIIVQQVREWSDCLFDVAWSESDPNTVVAAAGDGSILLWSLRTPQKPVAVFKEHLKEVYSVHWNQTRSGDSFLSGSWDNTVKLWDSHRSNSIITFNGHRFVVYCVVWSPLISRCFASSSGDGSVCIWDTHNTAPSLIIPAHKSEVLTCDWCKYNQNVIVTGASDSSVKGWDLRNFRQPIFQLDGHRFAVRRVKYSPYTEYTVATCSYDFCTRIWDVRTNESEVFRHHTEFVYGIDFNSHIPGQMADCAWDGLLHIFQSKNCVIPPQKPPA